MTVRVVVTNDDGIDAAGLPVLARVALELGCEVTVASPLRNSSGASSSLLAVEANGRVVVERRKLDELDVPTFGVGANPGYIALLATRGAFGDKPDVVLSGINDGVNTGHAILHSGTVGATLTARNDGCRCMAVSLAVGDPMHWDTAAHVTREVLPRLLEAPEPLVLNVNVPSVPLDQLKGIRRATLANFGAVQTNVSQIGEGFVQVEVADLEAVLEPGTDAALLNEGYATVTPLNPLCEAADVELGWLAVARRQ